MRGEDIYAINDIAKESTLMSKSFLVFNHKSQNFPYRRHAKL